MERGCSGEWITVKVPGEDYRAFKPHALPPTPPIEWSDKLLQLRDEATLALAACREWEKL